MKKRQMLKGLLFVPLISLSIGFLAGASSSETEDADIIEAMTEAEEDEENYMTGDASRDDPLNADEIGDREILVVSFGTSYNYSRYSSIGGIERAVAEAYPDWSVRRAFTADIVINHVMKRDGEKIDRLGEALDRAVRNGVKELIVCPTHLMEGYEYNDIVDAVSDYAGNFEKVAVTDPLFGKNDSTSYMEIAPILADMMENYNDSESALVYMGHGTEADSDKDYGELQAALEEGGFENIYITTVESEIWNTQRVLDEIADKDYKKVVLHPLMVVAGDHAHNDMDGNDPDSLRSQFEAAGYEVDSILDGLGQNPDIQKLYVERIRNVMDQTFDPEDGADTAAAEETDQAAEPADQTDTAAAEEADQTAEPADQTDTAAAEEADQTAEPADQTDTAAAEGADQASEPADQTDTVSEEDFISIGDLSVDPSQIEAQMDAARDMDTSAVADNSEMIEADELEAGDSVVTGSMLRDGTYDIEVESSSSMFKVLSARLKVEDGRMTADLLLSGQGYLLLYPGTAMEAAEAAAEDFIYFTENNDGKKVFLSFPLEELNSPVDCAAFSKKKEQWYPRTLIFRSDRIDADAFLASSEDTEDSAS